MFCSCSLLSLTVFLPPSPVEDAVLAGVLAAVAAVPIAFREIVGWVAPRVAVLVPRGPRAIFYEGVVTGRVGLDRRHVFLARLEQLPVELEDIVLPVRVLGVFAVRRAALERFVVAAP